MGLLVESTTDDNFNCALHTTACVEGSESSEPSTVRNESGNHTLGANFQRTTLRTLQVLAGHRHVYLQSQCY